MNTYSTMRIFCLCQVTCCSAINFSRLIELKLFIVSSVYWLEPLILLLHNAPKLKVLILNSNGTDLPLSWSQSSSVPRCLLSQLEIFEWKEFGGRREEKQLVSYILSNSNWLKTAGISPRSSYNDEEKQKIMEDLESMYRVSASSQFLFTDIYCE
ncbi:putative F-box/FBD/LRR-repeat protein [Cardamine amara subsp. amara]